jgi:hypothetical protein
MEGGTWFLGLRAPPAPGARETMRTWEFRGVPFSEAVDTMLRGAVESFVIAPDVPDRPIYFFVTDLERYRPPLLLLTSLVGATYRREDGITLIHRSDPPSVAVAKRTVPRAAGAAKPAVKPISLHLERLPLRRAIAFLSHAAGESHRVEPDVPDMPITLSVRDGEFTQVLQSVARIAGLLSERRGETYILRSRHAVR